MSNIPYFYKNVDFWTRLPAGGQTQKLDFLNSLDDEDFFEMYEHFISFWEMERGWEYERYSEMFEGKDVVEIGSGLGYDGITYSQHAKTYTFCDINPEQISTVKRAAKLLSDSQYTPRTKSRSNHEYQILKDPLSHDYDKRFNALYSHGVLHHVPFETAQKEFQNVDRYLEVGSKIVLLMYPKNRWENAGKPDPTEFGRWTDPGCPWSDWYDEEKILRLVGNHYSLDNTIYWGKNKAEFVNFEMTEIKESSNE